MHTGPSAPVHSVEGLFDTLSPLPLQWSLSPQEKKKKKESHELRYPMEDGEYTSDKRESRRSSSQTERQGSPKGACAVVKGISLPEEKN